MLQVLLLSMLPIAEVRGGIPLGMASHLNPATVFLVAVFGNILIIPLFFIFLDYIHKHCMKMQFYRKFFTYFVERTRKKIEHRLGKKGELFFLWFFVAIPLPATGAYTGTLIAWFFNLKRIPAMIFIALGVLSAAVIVMLVSLGIFSLF